jgi:hypothetical protein
MYIGVKSDLYQLGMVLWALATQEDEPDAFGRPLKIEEDVQVPAWYRRVVNTCLSTNPRDRVQAIQLLSWFPASDEGSQYGRPNGSAMSLNGDANPRHDYLSPTGIPRIKTVHPPSDWAYVGWNQHPADEPFYYPSRGRSPPSPMPSNQGDYDPSRFGHRMYTWSDSYNHAPTVPSVSDVLARESKGESEPRFKGSEETLETYADGPYRFRGTATETSRDDESLAQRGRSLSRKNQYDGETEPAGHDDRGSIPTSTWGPPWRLAEGKHDTASGNRSQSRGNTGPESQADSGKDVTERASTPREHRGRFTEGKERSVSRGRSGRSSAESASRQDGPHGTTITTATEESTHLGSNSRTYDSESRTDRDDVTHALPHAHEHEPSTNPAGPPTTDSHPLPHASFERADADLKGIGSAYGPALLGSTTIDDGRDGGSKRQHEIIIDEEEDLGGADELDRGLREALATHNDRPSSS